MYHGHYMTFVYRCVEYQPGVGLIVAGEFREI